MLDIRLFITTQYFSFYDTIFPQWTLKLFKKKHDTSSGTVCHFLLQKLHKLFLCFIPKDQTPRDKIKVYKSANRDKKRSKKFEKQNQTAISLNYT